MPANENPTVSTDVFEKQQSPQKDRQVRALETVRRFMHKSREYREPYLKLAAEARKIYEVWEAMESRTQINRSALRPPYAYQIIQEEIAGLAVPFFQARTPFRLTGEIAAGFQFAGAVTDHAAHQLDQAGWGPKFLAFLENLCVEGTAIQKVPYVYQEKTFNVRVTRQDPVDGTPYFTKEPRVVVCQDGPGIENVRLDRFYPDWTERTPGAIQPMRGCAVSIERNLSELRRNAKQKRPDGQSVGTYINLDELEFSVRSKGAEAWEAPYFEQPKYRDDKDALKKPIEVWEYWGLFDTTGNGDFEEYIIAVANGDVVIRLEENFYDYKIKPFVATPNIVRGNHWYGLSELFALRGNILEASRLRNSKLDAVNMAVNPMWAMERSAGADPNRLYMRSNGIILLNNLKGLMRLPPPEIPPSVFNEVNELGSEMQQVSGTMGGPNLAQAGKVFGRSASGAQLVSNIANARVNVKMIVLSELYFKPLSSIQTKTNAQFVTANQDIKSRDPDALQAYLTVPAEAWQHDYAYEPIPAVMASGDDQKMQSGLPFLQAAETAQPGVVDWQAFFEDAGRDLFGREVRRFIRSPEQVAQMQAMQLASQNAVNAMQGAAAPQPQAPGPQAPTQGGY